MLDLFKTKWSFLAAFLAVFLFFGFSSVSLAQDDLDYFMDDEAVAEFDAAMEEWEDAWGSYDPDQDSGNYWIMGGTDDPYGTTVELGDEGFLAALAIVMGIWGIIMLPLYIYFALTLMTIAKKLDVKNAWFAWIPILNIILMLQCAKLSPWLFLLVLIPFVNIIIMVYAYMKIAENRGFESWLGILMIVPVANLIIPGYLAWGEPPKKAD